jgi:hypothetical protein
MVACFVAVHAMQVEVRLDDPATAAQIAQYAGRQSRPSPRGFVPAFKMKVKQIRRRNRLDQRCLFVPLPLPRDRRRGRRFMVDAIGTEGRGIAYRRPEQCLRIVFAWKTIARFSAAHLSLDRKSTRLNSSHNSESRMPSSA